MQITVKSTKVAKIGKSDKGAWELIVVTSDDGTAYTTFDKRAKHLDGAVIDIGEPTIKEGKISFKEVVKVISEPEGAAEPLQGNKNHTESVKMEVIARARNTALMQAVAVYCHECLGRPMVGPIEEEMTQKDILPLANKFAHWLIHGENGRLEKPKPTIEESPKSLVDMEWLAESLKTLEARAPDSWNENVTLNWMVKAYKVSGSTIAEAVSQLDTAKAKHFVQKVQEALEGM